MHSVYLRFEGPDKPYLESFRKEYDSLAEKIEAHITVLFPNDSLAEHDIVKAVKQVEPAGQFQITVSENITYKGDIGFLIILGGVKPVCTIYEYFLSSLTLESPYEYVPHITLVRDSEHRPSSIGMGNSEFTVSSLVVEKILECGSSKTVYEKEL